MSTRNISGIRPTTSGYIPARIRIVSLRVSLIVPMPKKAPDAVGPLPVRCIVPCSAADHRAGRGAGRFTKQQHGSALQIMTQTNSINGTGRQSWPACIGVEEASKILGWPVYFFPVLMRERHLKPLGKPTQNGRKWFATAEIERLSHDLAWLDKAVRIAQKHVSDLNRYQKGTLEAADHHPESA